MLIMISDKVKQTALAILVLGILSVVIVLNMLPGSHGGNGLQMIFTLKVFISAVLWPLSYFFLFGSYDASIAEITMLVLFLVGPIILYYYWYKKNQNPVILGLTISLWVGFGGFLTLAGILKGI